MATVSQTLGTLPRFFLAVDDSSEDGVIRKVERVQLVRGSYGIKVNLDLVLKSPHIIARLVNTYRRPVFVDLKMFNGQRTMAEIVQFVADLGACMTNAYALASRLLDRAARAADDAGIVLLGVTVLTHFTEEYCRYVYRRSLNSTVHMLATMALENGCHGYILPGTTLGAVADMEGLKFNPAVRPAWFSQQKANDQEQLMEPGAAHRAGARCTSCGSPVFSSQDPADALERILYEVNEVT